MEILEGAILGLNVATATWTIMTVVLTLENTSDETKALSQVILSRLMLTTIIVCIWQLALLVAQGIPTAGPGTPMIAIVSTISAIMWTFGESILVILAIYCAN